MPLTLAVALAAAVAVLGVAELFYRVVLRLAKRSVMVAELAAHNRPAFPVFLMVVAVLIAVHVTRDSFAHRDGLLQALGIAVLVSGAWLAATTLLAIEDVAESRYRIDVPDNRQARRIRTQVLVLRRVTVAVVVVVTLGLVLMTFPEVRSLGTSLLASAGIIGIIAALAAHSVLGNVIAGLQLVFSDAIRLDDVVVVEDEWCRVEEITLSHVVLQIWDDRRLILPTSYFTTKPYQNWTRTRSEVLGAVEFDVDWDTPVPQMRDELRQAVEASDMWDGRVCVLQVTDAVDGVIRLRALVSAVNAPTLWDLRCLVREHLVAWVRDRKPVALPRRRIEAGTASVQRDWRWSRPQPSLPKEIQPEHEEDSRVFGGSYDGQARAEAFTGPMQETVLREQAALDEPPDLIERADLDELAHLDEPDHRP
jgi:small-conductance mechanosensitive channel